MRKFNLEYNFFLFTGKFFAYGFYFLDQLRQPEIIHPEFQLKTSLDMNSITLVQFIPLTNLKELLLTQDFFFRLDPVLQKNWRIKKTI